MRIGISGAANCGKTTLAHELVASLGLEVVPELLGEPFDIRVPRPPEDLLSRLIAIDAAKAARESELENGFVCDRTSVDLAVQCYLQRIHESLPDEAKEFVRACRKRIDAYDVIIFPPGPSPILDDENYYGDPARLWRMWHNHTMMMGLAKRWVGDERLLIIPDGVAATEARVAWVMERLNTATNGQL